MTVAQKWCWHEILTHLYWHIICSTPCLSQWHKVEAWIKNPQIWDCTKHQLPQSKHQLPAVVVALLLPTSSQIPLRSIWTSGKFSEKPSICWGVEQHVGTWWAFHSWNSTCLQKGNRSVPCFMVKEGVGSSKKPTTFAGVPAATVLHDWTHPRHLEVSVFYDKKWWQKGEFLLRVCSHDFQQDSTNPKHSVTSEMDQLYLNVQALKWVLIAQKSCADSSILHQKHSFFFTTLSECKYSCLVHPDQHWSEGTSSCGLPHHHVPNPLNRTWAVNPESTWLLLEPLLEPICRVLLLLPDWFSWKNT